MKGGLMNAIEEYDNIFFRMFEIEPEQLLTLEYQSIESWDSVGHMSLIVSLEEAFGVSFEIDDILDFSSYSKGIEILRRYSVEL
jgi:acyl carrier protein